MYGDQMVRMLRAVDMLCTATGVTKREMAEARGGQADSRSAPDCCNGTSINRLCAEVNRRILAMSVTYLFQ